MNRADGWGVLNLSIIATALLAFMGVAWCQACAQASAPEKAHAQAAGRTIDIPEGTPVVVHFFGGFRAFNFNTYDDHLNNRVLQVDQDVIVNGVTVVPAGSLGLARIDSQTATKAGVKGRFIPGAMHYDPGTQTGFTMHLVKVFSIASTELELEPDPIVFDFKKIMSEGRKPENYHIMAPDRIFNAKLKHATLTLP